MKGVILAGGLGTRLYPLTHATNKHLLPVYDQPMIYYPIQTLVNAGIKDILLIIGGPHAGDFIRVLKNGEEFGVKHLELMYQEKPDGGIADALALAEDFAEGRPVTVILGDNTTDAEIKNVVESFEDGAHVFLKKVSDPERFGVPRMFTDRGGEERIKKILEKPKNPPSNLAVTGLYIYDDTVFDKIRTLKPSKRGQLEITDLNNLYIKGNNLGWSELKGFWKDAGTFESLYEVNSFWKYKNE